LAETVPIAQRRLAKRLESDYQIVSRRGFYRGDEPDSLAQICSDLLPMLPPHRRIVAFALGEFFTEISRQFDHLARDPLKWPAVDNAVLQGVRYVSKGTDQAEAVGITDGINMVRLEWCGELSGIR
jgi:hypothetical protein